ncbi:MAG TPA: DUF4350 domain-containing protein [Terriglobia bacterium]|nr:DUF4350 domain-containing protein [Terriglobia bacterium]
MSSTAKRTNRLTALISLAIALVLTAAIAALSPQSKGGDMPTPPSTFFATDRGTKAIYLVFQRLMPETSRWRLPLTELRTARNLQRATLIALGPPHPLTGGEADALDMWIRTGGQLILATGRTWDIQNPHGDQNQRPRTEDYLARHQIQRRSAKGAEAPTNAELKSLGQGRIIYVPDSFAFSNETLRSTDNAVWLAERASEWGKVILFDEYHHGYAARRGFFSLIGLFLFSSPWGFVCLQLALAGIVYIAGYKRRFGKIVEEVPEERTSPIEAAEALGGLFRTAQARTLSVRSIHQHLNMELSRLIGHRVDLLNPESRTRFARRSNMSETELDAYANAVAVNLRQPASRDDDLVWIARTANTILRSLDHGPAATKRRAAVS